MGGRPRDASLSGVTEPPRTRLRVPVDDARPAPDPARTGCLWIGGIVGVVVGVVVVFFAVPSILNFLFPSETIAVGETFENDKLELKIVEVVRNEIEKEPENDAVYVVRLEVNARSSWSPRYDNFVLVLDDDTEIRAESYGRAAPTERGPANASVPQGRSVLELQFSNGESTRAGPHSLHLEEPPVKFELPEPTGP